MGYTLIYSQVTEYIPYLIEGAWISLQIAVSAFRELLGFGQLLGYQVIPTSINGSNGGWYVNNGLMILAPGAFIILGLIIWFQRIFTKVVED